MDNNHVSEQADDESGDVQTSSKEGHTVSVIPQEDSGTAEETNDSKKDWRKSDKEWQQMTESSKKGEAAAQTLEALKSALGLETTKKQQDVDVVTALTSKIDALEMKAAKAEWEKSHPAVDSAEYREEWNEIVKKKAHLVKSGDLTYDDLWAIIRKGTKPSTSNKDFKHQELNIGSMPAASKTVVYGSEIDPEIEAAMKRRGWTADQIKMSA